MDNMKLVQILLFLLVISLVLQNTCPYGFASKTAFAAPQTHDCPFKKNHQNPVNEPNSDDDNPGKLLYPSFVFSVPDNQPVISRFQTNTEYIALSSENYKDPFKEPTIRPPVA